MKRIIRDPEKFEVVGLYDAIGQKRGLKLNDPDSDKAFLESVAKSLGRNRTSIILHGRRIEAMFGYVAASLGKCIIIKQEDCGEVFSIDTNLKLPDYRLVLDSGKQLLVEVKNCHKKSPQAQMKFKMTYLAELQRYCDLVGVELMIAIYWSRWNQWTLVRPSMIPAMGEQCKINFIDAYKQNEMAILGDFMVATIPPLSIYISTDPSKPGKIDEHGEVRFTIGKIDLRCGGITIQSESEQNHAFYFMLYGEWPTGEPRAKIEHNILLAIEYIAAPEEPEPSQPFQIIGTMSGMISRRYNDLTAPQGAIDKLTPSTEPGSLGIAIPPDYKGKHLPLWRFTQQPSGLPTKEG